jgi:hypothetical protein
MDATAITKRIDDLIALARQQGSDVEGYSQLLQGTTRIMELVYDAKSRNLAALQETLQTAQVRMGLNWASGLKQLSVILVGALNNVKQEVEAGLIGSLTQQVTGDVLADFIKLARAVLDESGDGPKNVAAVLAAAAFEDTIRRMGASLAGTTDEKLQDVLIALKDGGHLQGPQFSTGQSFLTFRNHALHAEWDKLDRVSIQSALAFVQELLLKHFS